MFLPTPAAGRRRQANRALRVLALLRAVGPVAAAARVGSLRKGAMELRRYSM